MSLFAELKRRNVVRVGIAYTLIAWVLLQAADFFLDVIDAPNWVIQALLMVALLGLVGVIVFSWIFEMTPEGLKRETEIDRSQSIAGQTGRKLDRVIITALAAAVAYLLVDKLYLQDAASQPPEVTKTVTATGAPAPSQVSIDPPLQEGEQSIAVLPFVNMSADADNEYFSDGISEELLNVLVNVSSLHVASRTSAFAYKGKEMPVGDIARELNVDHILEGSVRKAGNRVRITAQLIDGKTDRHLWSETYERELDDIFDIQEEISGAIVDALKIALDVEEAEALTKAQHPTDNTLAYELYLQGRYRWRQRQEENILAAIDLFKQATGLDPEFAAAYEALAAAHGSLSSWSDINDEEALTEAIVYARKALELDPMRSEARAIVAEYHAMKWEFNEMLDEYDRAIKNAPNNATLHQWQAEVLRNLGYIDRAWESIQTAYRLDPVAPVVNNVMITIAASAGHTDLALKHAQITRDLGLPLGAHVNSAPVLYEQRDFEQLIQNFAWSEEQIPLCVRAMQDPSLLPQLRDVANQIMENPREPDPELVLTLFGGAFRIVNQCLVAADLMDLALDGIELGIENDSWYNIAVFWYLTDASRQLRQTQRFKHIAHKMGLFSLWQQRGWPDWCRPVGEDDFACE